MPLLNTASKMYVGSTPAIAVYLGSTKVWPTEPPPVGQMTHVGTTSSNPVSTGGTLAMPAGTENGDVLVVTVGLASSSRAVTFTNLGETANQSTSGHRCVVGLGVYNGSSVTYSLASTFSHIVTVTALRGVHAGGVVVGQALIGSGSAPPMVTPAITPVGSMAGFSVVCRSASSGTAFIPPSGVTEVFDLIAGTNPTSAAGGVVDMVTHPNGSVSWGQDVDVGGNGSVFTLGLAYL